MEQTDKKPGIAWGNTSFLFATPAIALIGTIWIGATGQFRWPTLFLAMAMMGAIGFGITGGYHRLFSHRSYEARWPYRLAVLLLGAAAFQNSARKWCADHRLHHRHTDRDKDPYNIQKGMWHAHMGWILSNEGDGRVIDNVADLDADPLIRFQHRFYIPIAAVISFVLPAAIASLWGDPWGGLIVAGFLRLVAVHHSTFAINSFCHFVGRQPYSDENSARDSWLLAFLTNGEGFHNFHHVFQADYRNGHRSYHWDPTKWLIAASSWIGLTKNLRRTNPAKILKARLRMEQKRLVERVSAVRSDGANAGLEWVEPARRRVEVAHARYLSAREELRSARLQRMDQMSDRVRELKEELRRTRIEFSIAREEWNGLLRQVPALA